MDKGKLSFSFVLVFFCGACKFWINLTLGKELRREVTCYSESLHLECGKSQLVAIHEAFFSSGVHENRTCRPPPAEHEYIEDEDDHNGTVVCLEDIRVPINRRCSGQKNCSYSYSLQPDRRCFNPEGVFVVAYDCMNEDNLHRYCNDRVSSSEGYISSPGYPSYYPQLKQCSWTLSAADGQTILVRILHLHLREATEVTATVADTESFFGQVVSEQTTRCESDQLSLVEGMVRKVSVCGEGPESLQSLEVEATTGVEVRFKTADFLPAAGFLLYFKIRGCPSLLASEGSVLIVRNGSWASYACRKDRVFNDTLRRTRFLRCVRNHHWNDTLPPCVNADELTTSIVMASNGNKMQEIINFNQSNTKENTTFIFRLDEKASLIADIVIPCVLMGLLVIVNAFILICICSARRKNKARIEEDLEVNPPEQTETTELNSAELNKSKSPPLVEAEDLQDD